MDQTPAPASHRPYPPPDNARRAGWLDASIASGFVATFAMTVSMAVAYGIANAAGDTNGNTIERWFAALSSNELTENMDDSFAIGMILNLFMGVIWAMVYALWFAQRLPGPGWRRGALFSLIPWFLSLVVFFPIAGIGFFGSEVDAGFLPALGNLILHLVYGVVLGALYRVGVSSNAEDSLIDVQVTATGERASTIGLLAGGALGFIGGWFLGPTIDNLASQPVVAFAGALTGAAMGMLMGSLLGVNLDDDPQQRPGSPADDAPPA